MTSLSRSGTLPPDIYGGTWNTCQQSSGGDGKGVPRGVKRESEKQFLDFVEQSYWLAGLPSTIYLRVNEIPDTHPCMLCNSFGCCIAADWHLVSVSIWLMTSGILGPSFSAKLHENP